MTCLAGVCRCFSGSRGPRDVVSSPKHSSSCSACFMWLGPRVSSLDSDFADASGREEESEYRFEDQGREVEAAVMSSGFMSSTGHTSAQLTLARLHVRREIAKGCLLELAGRTAARRQAREAARLARLQSAALGTTPGRLAFPSPKPGTASGKRELQELKEARDMVKRGAATGNGTTKIGDAGSAAGTVPPASSNRALVPAMVLPRWESLKVFDVETLDMTRLQLPSSGDRVAAVALACSVCGVPCGEGRAILAMVCAHIFCPRCFEAFLRRRWADLAAQRVTGPDSEQIPCPTCSIQLRRQDVHTLSSAELSDICSRVRRLATGSVSQPTMGDSAAAAATTVAGAEVPAAPILTAHATFAARMPSPNRAYPPSPLHRSGENVHETVVTKSATQVQGSWRKSTPDRRAGQQLPNPTQIQPLAQQSVLEPQAIPPLLEQPITAQATLDRPLTQGPSAVLRSEPPTYGAVRRAASTTADTAVAGLGVAQGESKWTAPTSILASLPYPLEAAPAISQPAAPPVPGSSPCRSGGHGPASAVATSPHIAGVSALRGPRHISSPLSGGLGMPALRPGGSTNAAPLTASGATGLACGYSSSSFQSMTATSQPDWPSLRLASQQSPDARGNGNHRASSLGPASLPGVHGQHGAPPGGGDRLQQTGPGHLRSVDGHVKPSELRHQPPSALTGPESLRAAFARDAMLGTSAGSSSRASAGSHGAASLKLQGVQHGVMQSNLLAWSLATAAPAASAHSARAQMLSRSVQAPRGGP